MQFSHQCPKCPLRFSFATELAWHLREEHRSFHREPTGVARPDPAPTGPPEPAAGTSEGTAAAYFLVVANQTLGGDALSAKLAELSANVSCTVRLLVPVTDIEGSHQWDYPSIDRFIPDRHTIARQLAEGRLEHEMERLRSLGVKVTGEVVDADPVDRVSEVIRDEQPDGIVVSTLPHRLSRWLVRDLPHRIGRLSTIPVTHVAGPAGPSI